MVWLRPRHHRQGEGGGVVKFSEALTEYLELREEGEFRSDWTSIDRVSEINRERSERMIQLLDVMDELTQPKGQP